MKASVSSSPVSGASAKFRPVAAAGPASVRAASRPRQQPPSRGVSLAPTGPAVLVPVVLRFHLPGTAVAGIAGTFNDWQAAPLRREGGADWAVTLRLAPGRHEYRLVTDGEWRDVPGAAETVANAYGSRNAVLEVVASGAA